MKRRQVLLIVLLGLAWVLHVGGASPRTGARSNAGGSARRSSSGIALTSDGATLLVLNPDSNSLTLVDTASHSIIAELLVGIDPRSVAVDDAGQRAYVANKIGWVYDPGFDFPAEEPGRWTVDVAVHHDRPYIGNGVIPLSHNTGTVLGTSGPYEFYVVAPDSPRLSVYAPQPGFINWPDQQIEPIVIQGLTPPGTTAVHYTIHDKGIVMGQGSLTPDAGGHFSLTYDAVALHDDFPMLSLTAHEGRRPGLADEVAIRFLATGAEPQATTVTLIGEEVFIEGDKVGGHSLYLPVILK